MPVTIRDVALQAGVSKGTVSKVLNRRKGVSSETVSRVMQACRELGYQPHPLARRLAKQLTENIGVMWFTPAGTTKLGSPFYLKVIEKVILVLEDNDYNLLVLPSPRAQGRMELPRALSPREIDGLIILGIMPDELVDQILSTKVPVVVVDHLVENPKAYCVANDNQAGAEKATNHLLELGHRRIALVLFDQKYTFGRQVLAGYEAALRKYAVKPDPNLVVSQGDYEQLALLLKADNPPTAIFAASDAVAVEVISFLEERGVRVPHDISVIGMDNNPEAETANPPLTTVHLEKERLGEIACELLLQLTRGEYDGPRRCVLPPDAVIVRSSTASPHTN